MTSPKGKNWPCRRCSGTGFVLLGKRTGTCFRCSGKGYLTEKELLEATKYRTTKPLPGAGTI